MPAISELIKKVKKIPAAAGKFLRKLAEKIPRVDALGILGAIISKVSQFVNRVIPGKKERLILGIAAAAFLFILSIMFVYIHNVSARRNAESELSDYQRIVIPLQDIFLPDEPDFVPGIMLERERRTTWTLEDAAPLWQDPLRNGEEQWRRHIETVVDGLMERVP